MAYRYRKWDLGGGVVLVCRCEHDAVMTGPNGETQFITIKALNEWDSKVNFNCYNSAYCTTRVATVFFYIFFCINV